MPDRSIDPGLGQVIEDVGEQCLVDQIAGQVGITHRGRSAGRPLAASTRVMLVPLPPKSHSAMTPRVGTRVVLQRGQRRRGIGDDGCRGRVAELRDRGLALRSASTAVGSSAPG